MLVREKGRNWSIFSPRGRNFKLLLQEAFREKSFRVGQGGHKFAKILSGVTMGQNSVPSQV